MSVLPLNPNLPWAAIQDIDISAALKAVNDQIREGWSEWGAVQIDLIDIQLKLEKAGIPLPLGLESTKKVEDFVLSIVQLLGWNGEVRANGDDWWIEIAT